MGAGVRVTVPVWVEDAVGIGDGIVVDVKKTIVIAGVELSCAGVRIDSVDWMSVTVGIKAWGLPERLASSVDPDPSLVAVATGMYEYLAKGSVHAVRERPSAKTKPKRSLIY